MRQMLVVVLAAIVAVPAVAEEAARIDIALSSFEFMPETITLQHGRAYDFHLTNTSGGGHDFSAKAFFAAARIAPEDRGAIIGGAVKLKGGESRDVHFVAPVAGTYPLRCSHFLHSSFGMTGKIVVT